MRPFGTSLRLVAMASNLLASDVAMGSNHIENNCIASSNKCLASSNKKLFETSALLLVTIRV